MLFCRILPVNLEFLGKTQVPFVDDYLEWCKEDGSVDLGDKTHHLMFNCSACDKEKDAELRDFLVYVKNNKAESEFTKEIANMVKTKKFEQTKIENARSFLKAGTPVDLIANCIGLQFIFVPKTTQF